MRTWRLAALLVVAGVPGIAGASPAQEDEPLASMERKLKSSDWRERERGFRELIWLRRRSPSAGTELLFALLRTERLAVVEAFEKGEGLGEAYGHDYYADLSAACMEVYRAAPTPERFRDLAGSVYNPGSRVASELSRDAPQNFATLTELSRDRNQYVRLNATVLLLHALAGGRFESHDRARVLAVAAERLDDPSSEVRVPLAFFLGEIRAADVHRILADARERWVRRVPPAGSAELARIDEAIRRTAPERDR